MEAQQSEALSQYRQRLLESLRDLPRRQNGEHPARIQVFVNQDCVGTLDCDGVDPLFSFATRDRSIHLVELRGETGLLIGGLSAPELGLRTARLAWSGRAIDVTVHNRLEGGSLRLAHKRRPSVWGAFGQAVRNVLPLPAETALPLVVPRGLVLAHVLLLAAVGVLIVDRVLDRPRSSDTGPTMATVVGREIVSAAQTQEAIRRLEETMQAMLAAQTASSQTLAGQQKAIVTVQRAVEDLGRQQKQMGNQVVSVQQMEEHQERIARQANLDVERMAQVLMGQVQSERAQLRDELHSLSMANEHLAKHVSSMEKKNQDLVGRLRAAGIEVSARVKDGAETPPTVAKEAGSSESATGPSQTAEARPDASPLRFFVSFQEGTTEESIDRWFQDLHARKGDADHGWYSVEVPRPPQQPAERFMEGLKNVKIVKAVATTRTRLSAR